MSVWRFTNLQPTKTGPTTSAGRQKKGWGRAVKSLAMGWVAMGVASNLREYTYCGLLSSTEEHPENTKFRCS